jgi:hypothetical protein
MTRQRGASAALSRRPLLVALALVAAAALAPAPAPADWSVKDVYRTCQNTGYLNELTCITPISEVPLYRKQINTSDGDARVRLTAWAQVDSDQRPIKVKETLSAQSVLVATLSVTGGPPPGGHYPTGWYQHSYIEGQRWLRVEELEPLAGLYTAVAYANFGAPCPALPTRQVPGPILSVDGTQGKRVVIDGRTYVEDPTCYLRPVGSPYPAAFVKAWVEIDLAAGPPGKVIVEAECWRVGGTAGAGWGICSSGPPYPIRWPGP